MLFKALQMVFFFSNMWDKIVPIEHLFVIPYVKEKVNPKTEQLFCFQPKSIQNPFLKATKIWNNLPFDWHVLSKRQIMREIVSNFVAFLEKLNFTNSMKWKMRKIAIQVESMSDLFFVSFF